jgi:hypothetical protein
MRFPKHPRGVSHDTTLSDRTASCVDIGPGVQIGALCGSLHACLEDVQRMATVHAVAPMTASERTREEALTPSREISRLRANGHDTCFYGGTDARFSLARSTFKERVSGRTSS